MSGLLVVVCTFGPLLSPREQRLRGMDNIGGHAGCWINDYVCGPGCIMAQHDGAPAQKELPWRRFRVDRRRPT